MMTYLTCLKCICHIRVPDGSAHDGFAPRRRMVRPSRFGPRTQTVRPTSLSLLNSATVDSAHSSSGHLSGGNLRIVVSANGLNQQERWSGGNYDCAQKHAHTLI